MACKLRVIIEKIDLQTNKIVEKTTVDSFDIHKPEKIMDIGLRHFQQIHQLKKIQQKCIDEQYAIGCITQRCVENVFRIALFNTNAFFTR